MTRPTPHPLFARVYEAMSPGMERAGMGELRRRLLADLTGEVVEVGAGNGLNFGHYPPQVERVLAVEPAAYLRQHARRRAADAPVPVEVVEGTAEQLPVDDHRFDAAVVSLVLCSVGDPSAAVAELRRVLRPGGQVRLLEHVRADTPGLAGHSASSTPRCGRGSAAAATPTATPSPAWNRRGSGSRSGPVCASPRAGCRRRAHRTCWRSPSARTPELERELPRSAGDRASVPVVTSSSRSRWTRACR